MDQKFPLGIAKLVFSPFVLGLSLFCATPSPSYSGKPEATQIEERFITQPGRYPSGKNATVEITIQNNTIYQTVTHEFVTEEKAQSKDPKTGAIATKTSTKSSTVSSGNIISEFPDAPWFSYLTKDGDVWSYDGRRTVRFTSRRAKRSPDGHVSSTGNSKSISFSEIPPAETPQVVAERIKQINAAEKKPTETPGS